MSSILVPLATARGSVLLSNDWGARIFRQSHGSCPPAALHLRQVRLEEVARCARADMMLAIRIVGY